MKSYKKYIKKLNNIANDMWINGLIDKPDKFVAHEKLKGIIEELEKSFEQDIRKDTK